jgi:XkdW protein
MIKSLATAVTHIYPHLTPFVDFRVIDDGNGQEIVDWTATEQIPTEAELDAAWLEIYKKYKKDLLDGECDLAIMSGFTSSALGTAHTYPSDFQAMVYYNATMHRIANDPTFTVIKQKTLDAGYLDHTREQFIQVFNEGHEYGETQVTKLNGKKADVDLATSPEMVDAVQW